MNIFTEHIAYLKDNPEGYWFKRKLYGFGWTPATKAGWFTTVLFMAIVIGTALLHETYPQVIPPATLLAVILGALVLFLVVVYKTGESPRWQWGRRKE